MIVIGVATIDNNGATLMEVVTAVMLKLLLPSIPIKQAVGIQLGKAIT